MVFCGSERKVDPQRRVDLISMLRSLKRSVCSRIRANAGFSRINLVLASPSEPPEPPSRPPASPQSAPVGPVPLIYIKRSQN